jgi:hypothetical protein
MPGASKQVFAGCLLLQGTSSIAEKTRCSPERETPAPTPTLTRNLAFLSPWFALKTQGMVPMPQRTTLQPIYPLHRLNAFTKLNGIDFKKDPSNFSSSTSVPFLYQYTLIKGLTMIYFLEITEV